MRKLQEAKKSKQVTSSLFNLPTIGVQDASNEIWNRKVSRGKAYREMSWSMATCHVSQSRRILCPCKPVRYILTYRHRQTKGCAKKARPQRCEESADMELVVSMRDCRRRSGPSLLQAGLQHSATSLVVLCRPTSKGTTASASSTTTPRGLLTRSDR
jgi:hypothetical protein